MSVAIVTSVSASIGGIALMTVPNKLEYCLRHGYSLVVDNAPYEEAVAGVAWLMSLFARYDTLWVLDADAVITNMAVPIHTLPCLGPHVTVCEEGIVGWNRLNCGSMVYRATQQSSELLRRITASRDEWRSLPCGWQSWLANKADELGDTLTVAPLRAFNSCLWTHAGGGTYRPGCNWHPGDLVYHPCGVYPLTERAEWIGRALKQVQR